MSSVLLSDLIYHKKNMLTKEQCQFLVEEYYKIDNNNFKESSVNANTGDREFSSFKRAVLIKDSEAEKLIFNTVELIINEYMDYLDNFGMFHKFIRGSMLYAQSHRILKYETGSKIHPHVDDSPFIYGSCTINLNNNYTGGDFVFWNGTHKIKLDEGEAMIFPADFFWVHEVEEIESGTRYSYNTFLTTIVPEFANHVLERINVERTTEQYKFAQRSEFKIKK